MSRNELPDDFSVKIKTLEKILGKNDAVSRNTINNWKNGLTKPQDEVLMAYLTKYNIDYGVLMSDLEKFAGKIAGVKGNCHPEEVIEIYKLFEDGRESENSALSSLIKMGGTFLSVDKIDLEKAYKKLKGYHWGFLNWSRNNSMTEGSPFRFLMEIIEIDDDANAIKAGFTCRKPEEKKFDYYGFMIPTTALSFFIFDRLELPDSYHRNLVFMTIQNSVKSEENFLHGLLMSNASPPPEPAISENYPPPAAGRILLQKTDNNDYDELIKKVGYMREDSDGSKAVIEKIKNRIDPNTGILMPYRETI